MPKTVPLTAITKRGCPVATRLGLAVAYGVVRQQGGTINVSSEPGKQTALKICLPATEGPFAPGELPTIDTTVPTFPSCGPS